jgi:phenylacetate-CoA ligase
MDRDAMLTLPRSTFDGAVFPAVPQGTTAAMLAVLHQLQRTQYLEPHELRELQFRQIAALAAHVDRTVSHYGISLRRAGIKPSMTITEAAWQNVPILTRTAVQDAGAALHAREVPHGHGSIASATTSGSSGRPVTIRKTALSRFYWQCFVLREQDWHQRDLGQLRMTLLRDEQRTDAAADPLRRAADWGEPISTVYPTGPAILVDYRAEVSFLWDAVLRERPVFLTTFPSLLAALVRESLADGRKPDGLREVRTVGEALSGDLRTICEAAWGVRMTDIYSAAEIGVIAYPCREHGRMHVQSESVKLEILRDDGTPCEVGEEGRVVLTPLHNFAMPLIRYEIGDRAAFGGPCACGRTLPVLAGIPGRARDMLTLPNGGRRFPYYGHGEIMRIESIMQHQVAQTGPDQIEIRLVVRRRLTGDEEARVTAIASRHLGEPFSVRVVYRAELTRGPGGKFAEFTNEYETGCAPASVQADPAPPNALPSKLS